MKHNLIIFLIILISIFTNHLSAKEFETSVDLFLEKYTYLVKGKRVGLITNNSGIDKKGRQTIDLLHNDRRINLVALFAPEHGVRLNVEAGSVVKNSIDAKTKLPIYSTYHANTKQPNPMDLKKVDVLIFHIQDIGCKTYTYIWTMAECMKAAAKAKIPIIIFDVPQLAGLKNPDGPIVEKKYLSFIGLYPTAFMYGLTVGEMARFIRKEYRIPCTLIVIPMRNYSRTTPYYKLGMKFVPLSPNIPNINAAYGYYISGAIGEMGLVNIGLKQGLPFQIIGTPTLNAKDMANYLNSLKLGGVYFLPMSMYCTYGRFKGQRIYGVKMVFRDVENLRPMRAIIAIVCYMRDYMPNFKWNREQARYREVFDKAVGTSKIRLALERGDSYYKICSDYQAELRAYQNRIQPYKIYR